MEDLLIAIQESKHIVTSPYAVGSEDRDAPSIESVLPGENAAY